MEPSHCRGFPRTQKHVALWNKWCCWCKSFQSDRAIWSWDCYPLTRPKSKGLWTWVPFWVKDPLLQWYQVLVLCLLCWVLRGELDLDLMQGWAKLPMHCYWSQYIGSSCCSECMWHAKYLSPHDSIHPEEMLGAMLWNFQGWCGWIILCGNLSL